MKKIVTILFLIFSSQLLFAQFEQDILKFSRTNHMGTARSAAMGGAFGALGGDLSTASTNPAGIGVFRKSEVNFTPLVNFTNTKSSWNSDKNSFQISNLGFVASFYNENFDWRGFNIAFNYTQLNNYNRILEQSVWDSPNSLLDVYAYQSFGYTVDQLDPFSSQLAFDTYLLNEDLDTDGYYNVLNDGELVDQHKYMKEKGYQGEYAISFGTNYMDKVYLGFTVGIPTFNYKMYSLYLEEARDRQVLDYFDKYEGVKISGTGVNLKFGLIYRPIPQLRIGAAIHTPTWYNIDYRFRTDMTSSFFEEDPEVERDELVYQSRLITEKRDVDMRTPWRAILSVATILQQKAIISLDYEYVDYTSAKYSNPNDYANFHYTNQNIKDWYTSTHNVRIGAEYRFNSILSLRGGYSYMASPYKNSAPNFTDNISDGNKTQTISGGFGLNFGQFYIDAAFTHMFAKDRTIFYNMEDLSEPDNPVVITATPIKNKYINNQARISLGVRF